MKTKIKLYMSHPIRGPKREKATDEDMRKNNQKAIDTANKLRAYFLDWHRMDGLPEVELYVPAENDEFVLNAHRRGYLNEEQILACDGDIIDTCQAVLAMGNPRHSAGMQWEIAHATATDKPVFQFNSVTPTAIKNLRYVIDTLLPFLKD